MARARRHPINSTSVRRRTAWARYNFSTSTAGAGVYTLVDLLSQYKADGGTTAGVTIARIHHRMSVSSTVTANDSVAWGILRGQNSDVGVTVAGAPQPVADPYEDWMMWEYLQADKTGFFFPGGGNVGVYDIRSKRKLPQLQQALLFVLGPMTAGVFPTTWQASGSILLMLP